MAVGKVLGAATLPFKSQLDNQLVFQLDEASNLTKSVILTRSDHTLGDRFLDFIIASESLVDPLSQRVMRLNRLSVTLSALS